MKRAPGAIGISLGLVLLQGCAAKPAHAGAPAPARPQPVAAAPAPAAPAPAPVAASKPLASSDDVVATIANQQITTSQLMQPLIEAHGLTVLLNLVQLELAKEAARLNGVTVTEADFAAERKATLDKLFADSDEKAQDKIDSAIRRNKPEEAEKLRKDMERDHEQLFQQFLQNQKVTRPEFELFLKTNTYLRKIAEPKILAAITEEELKKSFEVEYGASVLVRHIQGNNPAEIARAMERIRAGEPFEEVAKKVSRNPNNAGLGGELPRFSLAQQGLPENFKLAAFNLKEGEISQIVEAEGTFHVIKLERKFAPKAVKYESVKEILRNNMKERTVQVAVKKYREALAERARKDLKISEPVMAGQFAARLAERDKQIKDEQEVRRQMEKDRERDAEQAPKPPATGPAAPPATDLGVPPEVIKEPAADAAVAPPAPLPPSPVPPSPKLSSPPPLPGQESSGPIKPGIVVPVRSRAAAPAEATTEPARATKPAQDSKSAPAGK